MWFSPPFKGTNLALCLCVPLFRSYTFKHSTHERQRVFKTKKDQGVKVMMTTSSALLSTMNIFRTHIHTHTTHTSIVVTIFVWFKSQCEWMWLHWYFRTKSSLHQLLLLLLFYCYNMYCAFHYNRTCIIKHRFYERSFHSKTATGHWINKNWMTFKSIFKPNKNIALFNGYKMAL